jgi:tetratricopeptide (TPR) repeat protein
MVSIAGIGVPLLLMLVGWRWWTSRSTVDIPPREHAAVEIEPPREDHSAATQPSAVNKVATSDGLATPAVDDWVEELGELSKGRADTPRAHAVKLLRSRQYEKAVRAFDRLLMAAPNDSQAMLGKAMALTGAGRFMDAEPLFDRLLEGKPDDAFLRFNLAVAQMQAGRHDDARTTFEGILHENPDDVRARYNLAIVLQAQRRYIECIEHWRRLTQDQKNSGRSARAWHHRGECALALGLFSEAAESFDRFLQTYPKDAEAWCNLGIAQASLARYDQAIETLNKAIEIDPTLVAAWNRLASVYVEVFSNTVTAESRQAAIDCANRSLALFANQPDIQALRDAMLDAKPLTPIAGGAE